MSAELWSLDLEEEMRAFILGLGILLLMSWQVVPARVSAGGAVSVTRTFQPDETSGVDTYVSQAAPTTNFGTNASIITSGHGGTGTPDIRHGLLQFTDIANIPNGSTVSSATLSAYDATPSTLTRTLNAHRATSSWAESTVDYNTQPTFNATATNSQSSPASAAFVNWAVTSDVAAYVGQTATNYGWLLKDSSETHGGSIAACTNTFDSASGATATNRPKLAMTFTAVWDSYNNSGRTTQDDLFQTGENTAYMRGTGFNVGGSYVVAYYDGSGDKRCTEVISATGGTLDSICTFAEGSGPGTWNAVVFEPGITAPATFGAIDSNTHKVIGIDTFTVEAGAVIPELASALAAVVVAFSTLFIFVWFFKSGGQR